MFGSILLKMAEWQLEMGRSQIMTFGQSQRFGQAQPVLNVQPKFGQMLYASMNVFCW